MAAAPDEELRLYLLQLVQALKYENSIKGTSNSSSTAHNINPDSRGGNSNGGGNINVNVTGGVSSLASFLIDRASKNLELANDIYW